MTNIEWTDKSWNPICARNTATGGTGHYCVKVSDGCRNCYAETFQPRFKNPIRYAAQDRAMVDIFLDEKTLLAPLRWKSPKLIFVCSMTDLFAEWVPDDWIDQVFAIMALTPQHTYQVLTKRPDRMREYLSDPDIKVRIYDLVCDLAIDLALNVVLIHPTFPGEPPPGPQVKLTVWPLPNVWLGVSVEDRQTMLSRGAALKQTPAAIRFWSAEPLLESLGPIRDYLMPDQIIVGGESGPGARPMHPDWARSIRDQCASAGVAFFFKQWGECAPIPHIETLPGRPQLVRQGDCFVTLDGQSHILGADLSSPLEGNGAAPMRRIGKARAGRLLDGREHNQLPITSSAKKETA